MLLLKALPEVLMELSFRVVIRMTVIIHPKLPRARRRWIVFRRLLDFLGIDVRRIQVIHGASAGGRGQVG